MDQCRLCPELFRWIINVEYFCRAKERSSSHCSLVPRIWLCLKCISQHPSSYQGLTVFDPVTDLWPFTFRKTHQNEYRKLLWSFSDKMQKHNISLVEKISPNTINKNVLNWAQISRNELKQTAGVFSCLRWHQHSTQRLNLFVCCPTI